ncbi:MAG: Gfo/Idh/MocA family oxidoreductase [Planctomycetaceae bacterium]|nr:Gfo/Idh/MocA family oxidoreductase [Planctomycetaceae bacterium]
MQKDSKQTRRDFLKTSGVIAASAGLVSGLSVSRSAHAQGSDLIKVALVGCGGRGRGAGEDRLDVGDNMKLVAVADAFESNAKNAADAFRAMNDDEKYKGKVDLPEDRVFAGFDAYKKAIDLCDQVLIATPPGFRPSHYAYAIDKNKHVFMEKPLTTDAAGFRSLLETNKKAEEKGLTVVVGLQRRHGLDYNEWVKRIHDGQIGDVVCTRVYWNGGDIWYRDRQAGQNEMQFQMNNWYHFVWLSGDNITEQHIHNLDVGNWIHGKGDKMAHPVKAYGMGGLQARDKKKGHDGEIFDHHAVEFEYADGSRMFSQCRQIDNTWSPVEEHVHGTKGIGGNCWLNSKDEKWSFKGKNPNHYKLEHIDQVDAIRNGKKLHDGWFGTFSSMISVMGRMATYSGQVISWDEVVEKGTTAFPHGKELTWDTNPPNMPNADGHYPVAVPGKFNPFAG